MIPRDSNPTAVPTTARRGGEVSGRWAWTEPSVWTGRMLTALEEGVKGGVWFSLIDKVWADRNLRASDRKVGSNAGAPGVDQVTVEVFGDDLDRNVGNLAAGLRAGSYEPPPIRRVYIPKPGRPEQRPLGIPTVRDRVVPGAIRHVLEPIFEKAFAPHRYGFRPGRGCEDAPRRVDELLGGGFGYVVDVDLKSYFDTIPHDRLLGRVRERIAAERILQLIGSVLKAGIFDGLDEWEPEAGAPQGAVLSPLLSNIYLNPLDHRMASEGFEMVRYADDLVILCRTPADAEQALARVRQWCSAEGLVVHPTKTTIVDVRTSGFDFLGYHFATTRGGQRTRWPREKSLAKFKEAVRTKTKRTDGRALPCIITDLNRMLRGWFGYFRHSNRTTFTNLDGWIRGRLRSLLRWRAGGEGRGRGRDHQRWPNAFFAAHGYFSLEVAHVAVGQSPCG